MEDLRRTCGDVGGPEEDLRRTCGDVGGLVGGPEEDLYKTCNTSYPNRGWLDMLYFEIFGPVFIGRQKPVLFTGGHSACNF